MKSGRSDRNMNTSKFISLILRHLRGFSQNIGFPAFTAASTNCSWNGSEVVQIEVLKKIRKEGNKIPILLLTTMREAEERLNGLKDAPSSEQTAWRGMISSHGLSGSFRRRSEPYYDRRRVRRRCFRRRHLPDHRNQYARGHDVCAS